MKSSNFTAAGVGLLWFMMFAGIVWMAGMALDQVGVLL